ncbi:MAG: LolA family protein [Myxococcota bacterium]
MLLESFFAALCLSLAGCASQPAMHAQTGALPVKVAAADVPAEVVREPAPVQPKSEPVKPPLTPTLSQRERGQTAAKPKMAPEVKDLVDRMQAFYEKTQDFTASFRQDYTYKAFKRTQTSTGKVTFKKPALMRWEYQTPSPKTFVLAGERVYAHDPEAMTLTKASISTSQLSASVTFLWGKGRLADEFAITQVSCSKCQGTLLELDPLVPDPRFQKVRLEVDPQSARVLKSVVVDPDGSENAISFLEMKTNVGVDEKYFKLAPPPGTQIQDLTQEKKQ